MNVIDIENTPAKSTGFGLWMWQWGFSEESSRIGFRGDFGIEPELRFASYLRGKLQILPGLSDLLGGGEDDLITAFHVVEHLPDPLSTREISKTLEPEWSDREVPSSSDALLAL